MNFCGCVFNFSAMQTAMDVDEKLFEEFNCLTRSSWGDYALLENEEVLSQLVARGSKCAKYHLGASYFWNHKDTASWVNGIVLMEDSGILRYIYVDPRDYYSSVIDDGGDAWRDWDEKRYLRSGEVLCARRSIDYSEK